MNQRAKTGMASALVPAVWAGLAGALILGVATGCLVQNNAKGPGEKTPIQVSMVPVQPDAAAVAKFHSTVEPILQARCYMCHSGEDNHTGIAFDTLTSDDSLLRNPDLWLKVLKNTRSHVMPPRNHAPPTPQEQAALENWIEYCAFGVDPNNLDPGRQTIRRLNRTEYHNTIKDLIGVDFDTDTELPADDIGYGFDNIGDVLNVSPMLMEKYMMAAQTIVTQAVPSSPLVVPVLTAPGNKFLNASQSPDDVETPVPGRGGRGGGAGGAGAGPGGNGRGQTGLDLSYFKYAKVTHTFDIPYDGDYKIVVNRSIKGSFNFIPAKCTVTFSEGPTILGTSEQIWHDDYSGAEEFPVHWKAGKHTLMVRLLPIKPDKSAPPPPAPPPVPKGFPPQPPPSLSYRIVNVQIQGPMDQSKWVPAPDYNKFFPRGAPPKGAAQRRQYAREILGAFASRAFRRPAPADTVDRLADLAMTISNAPGGTFEKGVAQAMVAVLASPRFLYRVEAAEHTRGSGPYALVDEYTLASRLSYFLWSTMPDDELMKLAAAGQLRANLSAQIKRMLADPRSHALVENFTGQWLQSREVSGVAINVHEVMLREGVTVPGNQQVAAPVRTALVQEPEACFSYIMKEDRSVKEFLDADYVFVNQTLADYYKITGVTGQEMRKVMLKPGDLRGGALTFGATLMVTSNPTRTSPVKRGKWVLENILGAPTPPPPADVPPLELSANQFKGKTPTLREILAAHRASPQCATCHDRMDPIGLSMENFNAEGLYRTKELNQPIVAEGELFTGEKFKNVSDLKQALVKNHLPEFYRCLTEKMLIYATGRGMEYYDMPTIDSIVDRLTKEDGRFSVLLLGVINSAPFQEQRVVKQ